MKWIKLVQNRAHDESCFDDNGGPLTSIMARGSFNAEQKMVGHSLKNLYEGACCQ